MDATYWGKSFGVLLIVDAYRKRLLWRKFLDKKETIADYLEGIEWLQDHKFKILAIVCDGLWGLPQALATIEQMPETTFEEIADKYGDVIHQEFWLNSINY